MKTIYGPDGKFAGLEILNASAVVFDNKANFFSNNSSTFQDE